MTDEITLEFPMTIFSNAGHNGMLLTPAGQVKLDDGRMFDTVSGAATGATGRDSVNGWRFWYTLFGPNQTKYPIGMLKKTFPHVFSGDKQPLWQQLDMSGLSLNGNNPAASAGDVEIAWKEACVMAVDDVLIMENKEPNNLFNHRRLDGTTITFQYTFMRRIHRPDIVLAELRLASRRMPRKRAFQALILPDDPRTIMCYSCDDVSVTLGLGVPRDTAKAITQAWITKVLQPSPIAWDYKTSKKVMRNSDDVNVNIAVIEAVPRSNSTSEEHQSAVERASLRFVADHVSCLYLRKDKTHHVLKIVIISKKK